MGSREDDEYWAARYAEPPFCSIHEDEEMGYDSLEGEWWCRECEYDDEMKEVMERG